MKSLTSLSLGSRLLFLPLAFLVARPLHSITDLIQDVLGVLRLLLQPGQKLLGRNQDLSVLLYQFGEIVEQAVLRTQKVELIVPLFAIHQICQKLSSVTRHELSGQFDNITRSKKKNNQ